MFEWSNKTGQVSLKRCHSPFIGVIRKMKHVIWCIRYAAYHVALTSKVKLVNKYLGSNCCECFTFGSDGHWQIAYTSPRISFPISQIWKYLKTIFEWNEKCSKWLFMRYLDNGQSLFLSLYQDWDCALSQSRKRHNSNDMFTQLRRNRRSNKTWFQNVSILKWDPMILWESVWPIFYESSNMDHISWTIFHGFKPQ